MILSSTNTAGGNSRKTTLNEGILEISDLDNIGGNTGGLVFAGGILRFGTTLTDDISTRTITFLNGGGTIDTNSVNLALANSVGSGVGGLTKAGFGTLTLGATASYTGSTTVSGGVLAVTANNATGVGGALTVGAGATLDIGTSSINHSTVTTTGVSPVILGTGTITSTAGFNFTNTGDITVNAVLAGAVGLFKNQTNILTLTGLSTYTGSTEIQNGTVAAAVLANAGVASSLGAPTAGTDASLIRMGLTTASTTLRKTKYNIGAYLSFAISEQKSTEILQIIEGKRHEIYNAKTLYKEIKSIATTLFTIKNEAGVVVPYLFQNKDGFCFTVDTQMRKASNSMELKTPTFIFDYSATKTDGRSPDLGLSNFGPYDSINFEPKSPNILCICHKSNRGAFTSFLAKLKDGIPTSNYFKKGFQKKYDLQDVQYQINELSTFDLSEYLKIIKENDNVRPDLAIIEIPNEFRQLDDAANPYYKI